MRRHDRVELDTDIIHIHSTFAEPTNARMVELVDTRDLKSLGFTAVRVQVPLCAPELIQTLETISRVCYNSKY